MPMPPGGTKPPSVRIVLTAFLILAAVMVPVALAAKGGNSRRNQGSASAPLALVSETVWNSPNPTAPTWCLNEDDYHKRTWSGSLSGSFTATEVLCNASVDYSGELWWDAGGIGLQADVSVTGTVSDLTITSPDGVSQHGVLVGSSASPSEKTDHYQVCFVPPFSSTYNIGGTPLAGGVWQVNLSGTASNVSFTLRAQMADTSFQQQYCPPSEQNLTP
jgi:hypothetical protein